MSSKSHPPGHGGHGSSHGAGHGHAQEQAPETPAEVAPRIHASQIPSIKGLRLSPHGADAKLINISTSGLLAECNARLKVGSTVAVLFEGAFAEISVVGRIARCEVSTMGKDGVLRYHLGIDFNKPISLEHFGFSPDAAAKPAEAAPAAAAPAEPARPRAAAAAAPAAAASAAVRNRW